MNYKPMSKITIYSIIMGIFAIIGITYISVYYKSWLSYDYSYLSDPVNFQGNLLPIDIQASRAWALASLIICSLLTFGISLEISRMEKTNYKKYFVFSIGLFTWLMLPYTIYISMRDRLYQQFFAYLSQNRTSSPQISFLAFKNGLKKNGEKKILFWNTIFSYVLLAVTTVGFIFCFLFAEVLFGEKIIIPFDNSIEWLPGFTEEDYYNYFKPTLIFDSLIYFTQLTNIACFIFMLSFVMFSQKIPFRNNTIMICITSYISLVFVVFWTLLFPGYKYTHSFSFTKSIWLHAVTPLLFIAFFISSSFTSKEAPIAFKKIIPNSMVYLLTYGLFAYSLPFITRISVYGSFTNLNPDTDTSIGTVQEKTGSWLMLLVVVGIAAIFIIIMLGFWSIPYFINKKNMQNKKYNNIN